MPKRYDRCVRDVKKKITTGKIPKTYRKGGTVRKSNPYAICSRLRASGKPMNKGKKLKYYNLDYSGKGCGGNLTVRAYSVRTAKKNVPRTTKVRKIEVLKRKPACFGGR